MSVSILNPKWKMRGIIIYYIIFTICYIALIASTGIFLQTWGAKRSLFEKMYVFFLSKPFNLEYSFSLVLLNSLCWAGFFYGIV